MGANKRSIEIAISNETVISIKGSCAINQRQSDNSENKTRATTRWLVLGASQKEVALVDEPI